MTDLEENLAKEVLEKEWLDHPKIMKIIEFGEEWNKFFIPIEKEEKQTNGEYLSKLNRILDKFYKENSIIPDWNKSQKYHFTELDWGANNFTGMFLKTPCDVKYSYWDSEKFGIGIQIWSHEDYPEDRKPMINYLKEKWKELEIDN